MAIKTKGEIMQKKKGLKQGDLLSFFINDIKKHLPKQQNTNNTN